MAIVKDPFFEKLSGRLGDFVFSQRYGNTYVYYRPKEEKKNIKKKHQRKPTSLSGNLFIKNGKIMPEESVFLTETK